MARSILVIDDDQTLVALLKEGLESIGYQVAVAYDGLQGILQAHQTQPDLIILDFYMPGGGGTTVYERLRKAKDTERTPIIFSTNVSVEEVKSLIKPTANTFFLKKPVGLNQVVSVIGSILGDARAAEQPQFTAVPPMPREPLATHPASAPAPAAAKAKRGLKAPRFHEFEVRVTYADTDKMGIIYYANYFKYFELGRTELMRSLGVRYKDLEIKRKLFLPCVEANCRYLAPSRYDDLLIVRTWLSCLGRASVRFENEIRDKDLSGKVVARGFSRHAVVNDLWRTARVPPDLHQLLEPYVGEFPATPGS